LTKKKKSRKTKKKTMRNKLLIFLFFVTGTQILFSQELAEITPPVYPGCEQSNEKMSCMREQILNLIGQNFNPSELSNIKEKPVIIETEFTITRDGIIEINEIKTENKKLKMELLRVLSKIPPVKPAEKEGKPIDIRYKLPLIFQ